MTKDVLFKIKIIVGIIYTIVSGFKFTFYLLQTVRNIAWSTRETTKMYNKKLPESSRRQTKITNSMF